MVEILTASSILVAVVTWLLTHRRATKSERIQLTGHLIENLSTNEILDRATHAFGRMVLEGAPLEDDSLSEEVDQEVIRVLNYYEFLCDFCNLGALDRHALVRLRGKPMVQAWDFARGYVIARRLRIGYPDMYKCLEGFTKQIREQGS